MGMDKNRLPSHVYGHDVPKYACGINCCIISDGNLLKTADD